MRPPNRAVLLALVFGATALIAGCDSLPTIDLPDIDLSGFFDGNHAETKATASLDVVQQQPDLTLRFHGMALKDSDVDAGSNEITLHFDDKADAGVIADVQHSAPDWIAGANADGDTATIVANKDVEFSTAPQPDGFDLTLTPRKVAKAPSAAPTEPIETESLRGDAIDAPGEIDGLQREGLRGAFGVDDDTGTSSGSGL
jgi:hypothetical protein